MNFSFLPKYLPYFNYGAVVTVLISICVVFLGTILGVVLAFGQRSKFKPLVWLANLYVWIFRGTPMMVQIMIAFALMHINAPTIQVGILGVDLSRLIPGILIISMNSGAYVSETVRAGINAVPKGQLEAAYSLGIRPKNAMRYVILPQAIKIFCQHWGTNLSLLSRIVPSYQLSVSWSCGMGLQQFLQQPIYL